MKVKENGKQVTIGNNSNKEENESLLGMLSRLARLETRKNFSV